MIDQVTQLKLNISVVLLQLLVNKKSVGTRLLRLQMIALYSIPDKKKLLIEMRKVIGPVRDLNPGPPAPKAGIIPLDQQADV